VDVIAFTGHKSLMGPTGIGGLYVGDNVKIRQTRAGGTGVRSAERFHPEDYPYHLEFGTPNILGAAGLNAGVTWIQEQGLASLAAHEMKLTAQLREGLRNIPGVTLYCQDDFTDHLPVLTFNIDGLEAVDTGTLLDAEYNIACRAGLHCAPLVHEQLGTAEIKGAVRFGIGPFNTEEQIKKAVEAVAEMASSGIGRPKAGPSVPAEYHLKSD
jgi:cysteine desulfurase/selenocysteine lyase